MKTNHPNYLYHYIEVHNRHVRRERSRKAWRRRAKAWTWLAALALSSLAGIVAGIAVTLIHLLK